MSRSSFFVLRISPPVGKSGPFTCLSSPFTSRSGSSIMAVSAATTSLRLWGGMLVAVRVILAEHLADDGRRLPRPRPRRQAEVLVHGVEDAPLDGLQPVAHVGKGTRSDDAEGVAEIALLGGFSEIGLEWQCCGSTHRPPPHPRVAAGILPV